MSLVILISSCIAVNILNIVVTAIKLKHDTVAMRV